MCKQNDLKLMLLFEISAWVFDKIDVELVCLFR